MCYHSQSRGVVLLRYRLLVAVVGAHLGPAAGAHSGRGRVTVGGQRTESHPAGVEVAVAKNLRKKRAKQNKKKQSVLPFKLTWSSSFFSFIYQKSISSSSLNLHFLGKAKLQVCLLLFFFGKQSKAALDFDTGCSRRLTSLRVSPTNRGRERLACSSRTFSTNWPSFTSPWAGTERLRRRSAPVPKHLTDWLTDWLELKVAEGNLS